MQNLALYPHADIRLEVFGGIVFNATGVLVELDKADATAYVNCIENCHNKDKLKKCNEQLSMIGLQKLLAAQYLSFTKDIISHRVIEYHDSEIVGFLNSPISAHIYPSFLCNAKCFFCYNEEMAKNVAKADIDMERLFRTIDYLYEIGVPMINFLGGEPLLYYDKLLEALNYCNGKFFIGMASNGFGDYGFTKERCEQLSHIKNLSIRISIHHFEPSIHDQIVGVKGAFECALNSINNLVTAGVNSTWSCLPLQSNKNDILKMIYYAKDLRMSGFHMLNPHPTSTFGVEHPLWLSQEEKLSIINEIQQLDEFDGFDVTFSNWYYRLKRTNDAFSMCGAGNEIIEIDDKGNCYPCCIVMGNSKFMMGNILDKKLDVERRKTFKWLHKNRINDGDCSACSHRLVCLGGCPLANYVTYGDINTSDKECPYR